MWEQGKLLMVENLTWVLQSKAGNYSQQGLGSPYVFTLCKSDEVSSQSCKEIPFEQ